MKSRDPGPPPAIIKNNEPLSTTTDPLIALATEKGRLEMQLQYLEEKLKCFEQENVELKRKGEIDAKTLEATGKAQVWIYMYVDMYVYIYI